MNIHATEWKCKCGFRHGMAWTTRFKVLPDDWRRICSKCLPEEVASMKPEDDTSTDQSESEDSEDT